MSTGNTRSRIFASLDEQFADIDRRAPAVDEANIGLTHQQVYKAIWRAGQSTWFIRNTFISPMTETPYAGITA